MSLRFQMEYWKDGRWFVGRLPQVPGVFSQGASLQELEENLLDAYRLMIEEQDPAPTDLLIETKEIEVPV
jgi:predicted RNase H-like HicB family nuclease